LVQAKLEANYAGPISDEQRAKERGLIGA